MERLQIIIAKQRGLKELDTDFRIFGSNEPWDGHQYEVYEAIPEERVWKFEERANLKLPSEFVEYYTKYSNGGAGPDYGLYDFDTAIGKATHFSEVIAEKTSITPEILQEVFAPFPVAKNRVESEKRFSCKEFNNLTGVLALSEAGCGEYFCLVVNGDLSGTVWRYQFNEFVEPLVIEKSGEKTLMTFYDFIEDWLDKSLTELEVKESVS